MKKLPKLRTYQQLKFVLEREEYLETIMDNEQRRRVTALRGGTNSLRIEVGRWKGESLQDRTCTLCAKREIEDEAHVLLCCSAYARERMELYKNIQIATDYDLNSMRGDQEWLLHTLIGIGCEQRRKRHLIQLEVAKFVEVMFRKRARILDRIQDHVDTRD